MKFPYREENVSFPEIQKAPKDGRVHDSHRLSGFSISVSL